jgi:ubiquinol-cytochrome c reductase cytochrome b subunit
MTTPEVGAPGRAAPGLSARAEEGTRKALRVVDDRFGSATFLRRNLNKVFPDHWSFLLGEIALYSFILLILTGIYLTLFFNPSGHPLVYNGSYTPLRGLTMSEAYSSVLHISFDVRAGLLIRQIHHWAALVFVAAIVAHLFRIYFTGAFRKPREINWVIGVGLLVLGILEGFAGYSLPDDLLSGTGLRIAYGIVESIPIVGTWLAFFLFGGGYPSSQSFIPRLFIAHVLLIPGLLIALISAHLMILWHQKHTDFPGPGKTEDNVVGSVVWPGFALKSQGFMLLVFAVLSLLGGFAQINPIWLYGPYNAAQVSAGSQPDWYIGFLEGSLRLMPNVEFDFLGHTLSLNVLIPAVVLPGVLFTLMGLYPWLERRFTKDYGYHNLLDRPRNAPNRTALGVMSIVFYLVLLVAGGNDVFAHTFDWSLQATTWVLRALLLVLPPLAFYFTRRICLGLQHYDKELLEEGVESGLIVRLPSGAYVESTIPLPADRRPLIGQKHPELIEHAPGHPHEVRAPVPDGQHGPDGHGSRPPGQRTGGAGRPGGVLAAASRALERMFTEPTTRPGRRQAVGPGAGPADGDGGAAEGDGGAEGAHGDGPTGGAGGSAGGGAGDRAGGGAGDADAAGSGGPAEP